MTRPRSLVIALIGALCAATVPAHAQNAPPEFIPTAPPTAAPRANAPTLAVGDPAPPLDVRGFITGSAVDAHGTGPVRVIYFWSTVCLSCRATIPDLAASVRRHADDGVVVIGVVNEQPDEVTSFLETTPWGQLINFPVAIDRANASTERYLYATNRRTLPMAFIVGSSGTIEWFGSPQEIDRPLAAVVAGTWDRAEGLAAVERRQAYDRTEARLAIDFVRSINAEEWDRVLQLIAELEAADPSVTNAPTERLRVLLVRTGRAEEGYAAARDILRRFPRDARVLHRSARLILETPDLAPRNPALAFELAYRASEQMLHEHWSYLATLAAAHEANGRLEEAIQTMIAAIERTTRRTARESLGETLADWQMRLSIGDTAPSRTPTRTIDVDDERDTVPDASSER